MVLLIFLSFLFDTYRVRVHILFLETIRAMGKGQKREASSENEVKTEYST